MDPEPLTLKLNMNNEIFVITRVRYDWYRFQDNVGVAESIEDARRIAMEELKRLHPRSFRGTLKESGRVIEDLQESIDYGEASRTLPVTDELDYHIYIEKHVVGKLSRDTR
jgi:hypothetical protein|tara:strand:+ start:117 stop:449 length:333 start_codon:yes stop_codon:yes gene_type:complete